MMLALPERSITTLNHIFHSDALTLLRGLASQSVDMIFADTPYGVHEAEWDTVPDLAALFKEFKRILKPRRAIVMTAQQPFTTDVINAGRDWFKYQWVWDKGYVTDIFNAHNRPLRRHEDVLVFSAGTTANGSENRMLYNPQGVRAVTEHRVSGIPFVRREDGMKMVNTRESWEEDYTAKETGFPQSIISFTAHNANRINPNQKPVTLLEYLIRTYTNKGDVVVDPFMGSGTTALAARSTGRHFIGCDTDGFQVKQARQRLQQTDSYQDKQVTPELKQRSMFAIPGI